MIQANELRVGNLVNEDILGNCPISSVSENSVCLLVSHMDTDKNVSLQTWTISIENINPIPLTPEILEKAGFVTPEYFQDSVKYKDGVMLDLHMGKILLRDNNRIELKSVHQLQNLYFCLCGEELTIKL